MPKEWIVREGKHRKKCLCLERRTWLRQHAAAAKERDCPKEPLREVCQPAGQRLSADMAKLGLEVVRGGGGLVIMTEVILSDMFSVSVCRVKYWSRC